MGDLSLAEDWLLWSVPLVAVSSVSLCLAIYKLVSKIRSAELVAVQLAAETAVDFAERGAVTMHLAGPHFTAAFAGLGFELIETEAGRSVPLGLALPLRSSGLSEARVAYGRFVIDTPGRHVLRVGGLREGRSYDGCRVVFTRPYTLYALLCIVAIALAGGGLVGGVVMTLIHLGGGSRG